MILALSELNNGKALNTCATAFNIPRNTLRRHWLNTIKKKPGDSKFEKQRMLGDDAERDLLNNILALEERGLGLTPKDMRALVFDYCEEKQIWKNFNIEEKMAGPDWLAGFRARHRSMLAIRKPEALSLVRAQCMNKPAVDKYFDILKKKIE